jgi:hypothetical protein
MLYVSREIYVKSQNVFFVYDVHWDNVILFLLFTEWRALTSLMDWERLRRLFFIKFNQLGFLEVNERHILYQSHRCAPGLPQLRNYSLIKIGDRLVLYVEESGHPSAVKCVDGKSNTLYSTSARFKGNSVFLNIIRSVNNAAIIAQHTLLKLGKRIMSPTRLWRLCATHDHVPIRWGYLSAIIALYERLTFGSSVHIPSMAFMPPDSTRNGTDVHVLTVCSTKKALVCLAAGGATLPINNGTGRHNTFPIIDSRRRLLQPSEKIRRCVY